jgi:hypothetical protein
MRLRPGCRLISFLGLLLGGWTCLTASEPDDFRLLLKTQVARYPGLQVQDCYKLLFQACLGSEHAVSDPAAAAQALEKELANLGPGPDEPGLDPIAPDGRILRVHLRTLVQHKGDATRLAEAFVKTANTYRGSRAALAVAWEQVTLLAAAGELPFTPEAVRKYGQDMAMAGFPAVRHSDHFRQLYRPAYRVIACEYLSGVYPKE